MSKKIRKKGKKGIMFSLGDTYGHTFVSSMFWKIISLIRSYKIEGVTIFRNIELGSFRTMRKEREKKYI